MCPGTHTSRRPQPACKDSLKALNHEPLNPAPAMKRSSFSLHWLWRFVPYFAGVLALQAATFTSDTFIGINDSNFDGLDVAVTNATLTIDGSHTFASLHLLNGGKITHSFATNGLLENRLS